MRGFVDKHNLFSFSKPACFFLSQNIKDFKHDLKIGEHGIFIITYKKVIFKILFLFTHKYIGSVVAAIA